MSEHREQLWHQFKIKFEFAAVVHIFKGCHHFTSILVLHKNQCHAINGILVHSFSYYFMYLIFVTENMRYYIYECKLFIYCNETWECNATAKFDIL